MNVKMVSCMNRVRGQTRCRYRRGSTNAVGESCIIAFTFRVNFFWFGRFAARSIDDILVY